MSYWPEEAFRVTISKRIWCNWLHGHSRKRSFDSTASWKTSVLSCDFNLRWAEILCSNRCTEVFFRYRLYVETSRDVRHCSFKSTCWRVVRHSFIMDVDDNQIQSRWFKSSFVDDMRMTLTTVDKNDVKKETIIDIDVRILARSNISKEFHTTSIHSQQQYDVVQMSPTRFRRVLRSKPSTDT